MPDPLVNSPASPESKGAACACTNPGNLDECEGAGVGRSWRSHLIGQGARLGPAPGEGGGRRAEGRGLPFSVRACVAAALSAGGGARVRGVARVRWPARPVSPRMSPGVWLWVSTRTYVANTRASGVRTCGVNVYRVRLPRRTGGPSARALESLREPAVVGGGVQGPHQFALTPVAEAAEEDSHAKADGDDGRDQQDVAGGRPWGGRTCIGQTLIGQGRPPSLRPEPSEPPRWEL